MTTGFMTQNCKKTVTKTVEKNASIRTKNRDERVGFMLEQGRFLLFLWSKRSFYVAKAMLLHVQNSPFALS